jgi:hypothetical protein
MASGDRAYARGSGAPLLKGAGRPREYRVFRDATPLKDPVTGEILGYEASTWACRSIEGETTLIVGSKASPPNSRHGGHVRSKKKCAPATACCPRRAPPNYVPHARASR